MLSKSFKDNEQKNNEYERLDFLKRKNDEMAWVKEVEAKIIDVILSDDDLVLKKDIKSSSHHNEEPLNT